MTLFHPEKNVVLDLMCIFIFPFKKVWDIRTKAAVHSLVGHTNTIADVKCQGVEPQV